MIAALAALARLRAGNHRYVSEMTRVTLDLQRRRRALVAGQEPFAIVLGCSDSRVPAETVFDQGLGDLFSVRVAGNIAAPSQVGSIEFAVEQFGTRLVVVLGHSGCGAVRATLEALAHPADGGSPNLKAIVDRIRPVVERLLATELATELAKDPDALAALAVRHNIRASANHLRHAPVLQKRGVLVVGAEYSLETGVVDFFDGVAENQPDRGT